jgi:hypothetical protein
MKKESVGVLRKTFSGVEISILMLSLFAFSFMIYSTDLASGAGETEAAKAGLKTLQSVGTAVAKFFGFTITPATPALSENAFLKFFGVEAGGPVEAVASGIGYVALAYFAGQMLGGLFGLDDEQTDTLSTALAAGTFVYKGLATYTEFGGGAGFFAKEGSSAIFGAGGWGLVIAAVVFVVMYEDTKTEVVDFSCLPWQAPNGGANCEVCNDDDLPCSEYRCKSLGQACELLNQGTEEETCVNVHINDVNPPVIRPLEEELTAGHAYTDIEQNPPSPGFTILNLDSSDGCLKAFTPLAFGVETDEPSQCKIDFEQKDTFELMSNYIGGKNLYSYEHIEQFILPNAESFANSSIVLENGKDLTFFLRCRDANGNENVAEYAVNFCIDPSPDTTAPRVEATSILNTGCVAEEQSEVPIEFYINEPSNCKWDTQDTSYELMDNEMSCSTELYQINAQQLFTCQTTLTGVDRDGTDYYIKCKDQPNKEDNFRNEMQESYLFNLHGSTGLTMKNLKPNGTIFGAVSPAPVELYTETSFGCNEGQAICMYSQTGDTGDYIQFFDTDNTNGIHTQPLSLLEGEHTFQIACVDSGGNLVEDTINFNVEIDENAPVIARVYEEENLLKVVTVRDSECAYSLNSCDFSFAEGTQMPFANTTVHVTEWNKENTYFIKCRDEFLNEEADCSLIVKPITNFL